jgi:hypothetical protein
MKTGFLQSLLKDVNSQTDSESPMSTATQLVNHYFNKIYSNTAECDYILGKKMTLVCIDLLTWLNSSKDYTKSKLSFSWKDSIKNADKKLIPLKKKLFHGWLTGKFSKWEKTFSEKQNKSISDKECLNIISRYKTFKISDLNNVKKELGL